MGNYKMNKIYYAKQLSKRSLVLSVESRQLCRNKEDGADEMRERKILIQFPINENWWGF